MPTCPKCDREYRAGQVYCDNCAERLPQATVEYSQPPTLPVDVALEEFFARAKQSHLPISDECLFVFDDRNSESVFLPYARPTTIGRRDTAGPMKADIDLTRYGAFEYGVSRIHAALYRTEETLSIMDLNSRNGTFLNGQRLSGRVPYVLRNGDQVWFAKLPVHIYFKELEYA